MKNTSLHIAGWIALSAAAASAQNVTSVVNAGDYSTALSGGTVIAIRGTNLASETVYSSSLPLPTTLGGASAQFTAANGMTVQLPLIGVSPTEIRAQLPYDIQGTTGRVAVGASSTAITLSAISPRLITNFDGQPGDLILYRADYTPITRENPARPGDTILLFAHGLGQTTPPAVAGADPGFEPLRRVNADIALTINGLTAKVNEANLLPQNPGVYMISATLAYDDRQGTVPVVLTANGVASQSSGVAPLMPNGFYYQILANAPPAPIGLNGLSGASSSIATRHEDVNYWGQNGFLNWTKLTGLTSPFEPIRGIAITLSNGNNIVFTNNDIERRSALPAGQSNTGSFYANTANRPDGEVPGLLTVYSMSNHFNFVGGGFFRVTAPVTFDTVTGYFDGNGDRDLPLMLNSPYIKFRMNVWSNTGGNAPRDTGNFTGDVMSSDSTPGTWSWSYTGVDRIFRDTRTVNSDPARRDDPISRMVYKLNAPITLQPGDYWFSHDAVVPSQLGAMGFTAPSASKSLASAEGETREGVGQRVRPQEFFRLRP